MGVLLWLSVNQFPMINLCAQSYKPGLSGGPQSSVRGQYAVTQHVLFMGEYLPERDTEMKGEMDKGRINECMQ